MNELMKEHLTRLQVSAWMSRAVTEWICLALNMDEDDAGLNDDDNPSQKEADETIKDE